MNQVKFNLRRSRFIINLTNDGYIVRGQYFKIAG